jgi:hypothetical protein
MDDIDQELLAINREIYAAVKLLGDLVYNGFISIQIARDIITEITVRDSINRRRSKHNHIVEDHKGNSSNSSSGESDEEIPYQLQDNEKISFKSLSRLAILVSSLGRKLLLESAT